MDDQWVTIPDFPLYEISNKGEIYNCRTRQLMRISATEYGNTKISLIGQDGRRHTRSVAVLVAQAFVAAPNRLCDHLMVLDGDLSNVAAENLAWRPRYFTWKYTRQLKVQQPRHYYNLPVLNLNTEVEYPAIVEAGMTEGLLFDDIWRSTYQACPVFPNGHVFEIIERV